MYPKRKYLEPGIRKRIVEMFTEGYRKIDIAKILKISKGTVTKIIQKFDERGHVNNSVKTGRKRKTTAHTDRCIVREVKKNPFTTAREVKENLNLPVSTDTVRRRLKDSGLHSRQPARKPLISAKNRKARIEFAREHINWTVDQWETVLWSDESKFNLFHSDGRIKVWRPNNKKFDPRYGKVTVKYGGGKVLVWGAFSRFEVGPIVQIKGIMDRFVYKNILENEMLPFAEKSMPRHWIYQQDNDPKHSSNFGIRFFFKIKVTH